jgi:DNA gyrase inhibitor GyrI
MNEKNHVYVKYNLATNKVAIIRYNAKGNKELLTKTGRWIPWSDQAELLDGQTEIDDVYRYDPRSSPPDDLL